jgi:hypothetical protein
MKNTNKNININKNNVIVKIDKGKVRPGGSSKRVPQDCKPRTKCGNTGMMPLNMYELHAKACANRTCPYCVL